MARIRFTLGTRYLLDEQVYVIRQILVDGMFLAENQSFGGVFTVSIDDLTTAWARGRLRFEVPRLLARSSSDNTLAIEYTFADFQQLPIRQREEAWRRYQLLLPLLRKSPNERTRKVLETYAAELRRTAEGSIPQANPGAKRRTQVPIGKAISRASLQRWLSDLVDSGYDIRVLVPGLDRRARKGEVRLDADVENIVCAVLAECAANPMKRTANDIYLMVVNRVAQENRTRPDSDQLNAPSSTTIYRRIQTTNPEVLNRRKSRLEEQADAPVEDGPNPTRVLERVEIDHTLLDLFVVDEEDRLPIGRPVLTYALDGHCGMPCGFSVGFEPASYRTVSECLLHSILPKPDVRTLYETQHAWPVFGLMEVLNVDNGKDFTGHDLSDACAHLGIILERLPIRTPWFKGSIERFFRTNNTGLIHGLPGTSLSNVLEKGDYDAMERSCISLTAFWKLLHIFLLDYYAQQWHTGIKGIPAKRWHESVQAGFLPVLHTSAEETRILLMRTDTRVIQRGGIQFEWLFYRSPELMMLRSKLPKSAEVRFKYDTGDISAIYVSDPINGRWLRVPAVDQGYTRGLSLWKHRIINRFVQSQKKEVDIEALAAAKVQIQKIVAEEYALTRKSRGRKTAARLLDIGTRHPNYPTASPSSDIPASSPALPVQPSDTNTSNQAPIQPALDTSNTDVPTASSSCPDCSDATQTADANPSTPSEPVVIPSSADDLDDLDLTGWGGDYSLLKPQGDK